MFLEVYQNNFLFLQVSLVLNPIISFKARFFETLVPLTSALDQDMWLPSSFSRFTSRIIIEYQIATPPHGIKVQLSGKYRYYVAFFCTLFVSPVNYAVSLQRYENCYEYFMLTYFQQFIPEQEFCNFYCCMHISDCINQQKYRLYVAQSTQLVRQSGMLHLQTVFTLAISGVTFTVRKVCPQQEVITRFIFVTFFMCKGLILQSRVADEEYNYTLPLKEFTLKLLISQYGTGIKE